MPKKTSCPKPRKKYHRGTWEIFWNWNYKRYSVFPGFQAEADGPTVEGILRQVGVSLASPEPAFPEALAGAPGVVRYLRDRFGVTPEEDAPSGQWLLDYEPHIMQEVVESWAKPSLSMLRRLDKFTGDIQKTSPDQAQSFLDSLLRQGLKPARRNRALIMCNRFFKWAVRTKRTRENPFDGIKLMKEARVKGIAYCTPAEREWLINTAMASKRPDWMAIPIAFYAGMRRGEIYRMEWEDVDLKTRKVTIPITKTLRPRETPINSKLLAMLKKVPAKKRRGPVVLSPQEETSETNKGHTLIELLRRKNKLAKKPMAEKNIGWNVFRHTFGSLLAQNGVTLDKITAWMGNTPEVCRRHYAQFVPRDKHDDEIEKL